LESSKSKIERRYKKSCCPALELLKFPEERKPATMGFRKKDSEKCNILAKGVPLMT
jgi:hypothetical protein